MDDSSQPFKILASVEDYRDDDGIAEIASALAPNGFVGDLERVTDGLRGEGSLKHKTGARFQSVGSLLAAAGECENHGGSV